jgi:hypothetical protein
MTLLTTSISNPDSSLMDVVRLPVPPIGSCVVHGPHGTLA